MRDLLKNTTAVGRFISLMLVTASIVGLFFHVHDGTWVIILGLIVWFFTP